MIDNVACADKNFTLFCSYGIWEKVSELINHTRMKIFGVIPLPRCKQCTAWSHRPPKLPSYRHYHWMDSQNFGINGAVV